MKRGQQMNTNRTQINLLSQRGTKNENDNENENSRSDGKANANLNII